MTSSKPGGPRPVPPPQGSGNRPANAYTRFIPREELDHFAAWTPDTFGGGPGGLPPGVFVQPAAPAAASAATASAPPPPPPAPPAPSVEELMQAAREQAQDARQQGYQEGYRDGLEALEAAKRQFAQQISAQMAQIVAEFQDQLGELESGMADSLVQTALKLARQVVRSELQQRPDCVVQVAQQAVAAIMVTARHLVLRLHPDDVPLVEQGAGDMLRTRDVMLVADPQIERGGCLVESDLGRVDARIESRWAQAAAVFDVPLAWQRPAEAVESAAVPAAPPSSVDAAAEPDAAA